MELKQRKMETSVIYYEQARVFFLPKFKIFTDTEDENVLLHISDRNFFFFKIKGNEGQK